MIRMVLGIFGIAGILCALIIMPPVTDWRIFQTDRANRGLIEGEVQVTRNVEPTFSETGEIIDGGYAFTTDDSTIEDVASGVLAGLQGTNIDTLTPLQAFLVEALKSGQSDDAIHAAMTEAASAGSFAIPATVVTPDGRIDTVALLAGIDTAARTAEIATPVTYGTDPVVEETPQIPEVIEITGPRFHVVAPGESLSSISTTFFGSPRYGDLIYEANREILSDPNDLSVGQRLMIPEQ
jgi:hypothetical protein